MKNNRRSEVISDVSGQLKIDYNHYYEVDRRVEECHGYHEFEDVTTIGVEIISVMLIYNDLEIDITKKLSREEIKDLEYELMP